MSGTGPGRANTAGGEVSSGREGLRFRLQESGVLEPLWRLDGSRVRAVRTSNGGTALEARSDILAARATS